MLCFVKRITVSVTALTEDECNSFESSEFFFMLIIGIHIITILNIQGGAKVTRRSKTIKNSVQTLPVIYLSTYNCYPGLRKSWVSYLSMDVNKPVS